MTQDLGSSLVAVLLDLRPDSLVLDMSPASGKVALHCAQVMAADTTNSTPATGAIVATGTDTKRLLATSKLLRQHASPLVAVAVSHSARLPCMFGPPWRVAKMAEQCVTNPQVPREATHAEDCVDSGGGEEGGVGTGNKGQWCGVARPQTTEIEQLLFDRIAVTVDCTSKA